MCWSRASSGTSVVLLPFAGVGRTRARGLLVPCACGRARGRHLRCLLMASPPARRRLREHTLSARRAWSRNVARANLAVRGVLRAQPRNEGAISACQLADRKSPPNRLQDVTPRREIFRASGAGAEAGGGVEWGAATTVRRPRPPRADPLTPTSRARLVMRASH